jgi:hypothetical protein
MTNKRNFTIPNQGDGRSAGSVVFEISVIETTLRPPIRRCGQVRVNVLLQDSYQPRSPATAFYELSTKCAPKVHNPFGLNDQVIGIDRCLAEFATMLAMGAFPGWRVQCA